MTANPKELRAAADDKDPLEYLEPALEGPLARVMRHGAKKYGYADYRVTPIKARVYIGAIRRHVNALARGEDVDPESGELHWAHIAGCCAVVCGATDAGTFVDDRAPAPATLEPVLARCCVNCGVKAGSTRCGRLDYSSAELGRRFSPCPLDGGTTC